MKITIPKYTVPREERKCKCSNMELITTIQLLIDKNKLNVVYCFTLDKLRVFIMKTLKKFLFMVLVVFTPAMALAENTKEKMMNDLDIIKSTFEVKYAPKEWKKIFNNWELEEQINLAKVKIAETDNITVKDFQRILHQFFSSTKDYHVGVQFYSTEMAMLPFRVHSTHGKYYVAWVDRFVSTPINKGDEIVSFDGRPIHEVVTELKIEEFGYPETPTDQGLAEAFLTERIGFAGHIVPQGPVSFTVKHRGQKKLKTYRMNWFYYPEEITSPMTSESYTCMAKGFSQRLQKKQPLGEHPFFYKNMSTYLYDSFKTVAKKRHLQHVKSGHDVDDEDDGFICSEHGFLPNLGKIIWEAPENYDFRAYMYENNGQRIGYIRISDYNGRKSRAREFAEIISVFEQNADALVVDQLNNPGGNLFFMYALASMLSDQPLIVPKQRMTITQEDVYFAFENIEELEEIQSDQDAVKVLGTSFAGYPVDYDLAKSMLNYSRFIIDEWNDGRSFTQAYYFYGIDYLKPHIKGHFSKPILFLVNSLDFSCADFMPAILQDNKRATIMGMRTAGAGGYVLDHSFPNLFGVAGFSFTGSIAERLDNNPIENLGVIPDITYEMTEKDLQENYEDFVKAINKEVKLRKRILG